VQPQAAMEPLVTKPLTWQTNGPGGLLSTTVIGPEVCMSPFGSCPLSFQWSLIECPHLGHFHASTLTR
jgi:hypothetical protein